MLNAVEPLIKLPSKGLVTARPGGFETANVKVADLDDPEASVAVATKVCVPDVVLTVNWYTLFGLVQLGEQALGDVKVAKGVPSKVAETDVTA